MYRKTNIGGLIQYNPKAASMQLLAAFSKKRGVFAQVAQYYGVAPTTVRRWLFTLRDAGFDLHPKIERIRELDREM